MRLREGNVSQVCVILYTGEGVGMPSLTSLLGGVFLVPDPFRGYTGGNIPLEGTLPLSGADI